VVFSRSRKGCVSAIGGQWFLKAARTRMQPGSVRVSCTAAPFSSVGGRRMLQDHPSTSSDRRPVPRQAITRSRPAGAPMPSIRLELRLFVSLPVPTSNRTRDRAQGFVFGEQLASFDAAQC